MGKLSIPTVQPKCAENGLSFYFECREVTHTANINAVI